MENQHEHEPLKVEFIEPGSECECESVSLNSWHSEEESELDKIHRFKEKKILYELYREGKFDYNQLKEMLLNVR